MPRILRSLADLSDIETTYLRTGFAPISHDWLEGDSADIMVVIAAHELDDLDGTAACPNARALAAKAKETGSTYAGAKVFADALNVPYSHALGLADGWGEVIRDLDDTDELPDDYLNLINESQYADYRDLGEMLRKEMVVISLQWFADELGLTFSEVDHLAGTSNDVSIKRMEDAIIHMLQERNWDVDYISQRFSHLAYLNSGGHLTFNEWRESGHPKDIDEEIKRSLA